MLVIGETMTAFLQESELPEYARLNSLPGDIVPMDEDRQLAEALQRSASDAPARAGIALAEYLSYYHHHPVSYTHLTLPTNREV